MSVIYFGSMDGRRNLGFVLRVFARVAEALPEAHLLMLGDSRASGLEEAARSMGLADRVTFLGRVPRRDVPRYLRAARCSIAAIPPTPIYRVSSATKVVESLAMALPVVANREIRDQRQLVEASGGGYCPPYEEAALGEAVVALLADPQDAARRGRAGRSYVVAHRSYAVLATRLAKWYDEALAGTGERAFVTIDLRLDAVARVYGTRSEWVRRRIEDLFARRDFTGMRVLEVGAGHGLLSCALAVLGAREVVALEPGREGSQARSADTFAENLAVLGLSNVHLIRTTLQAFRTDAASFDRILLYAVVNHLDETHVQTLDRSSESRDAFLALLRPLREWLRPEGEVVLFDAARHHAFEPLVRAGLLRGHPLDPTMEWEKHQEPEVWAEVLREAGFGTVVFHWVAYHPQGWRGVLAKTDGSRRCSRPASSYALAHDDRRRSLADVARVYDTDPHWLAVRVEDLFGRSDFTGLRVLEVGAGRGLYACALAALGAREVVALEPDLDGSRGGSAAVFEANAARLGLGNLRLLRCTLDAFRADAESFDLILLYAVVNHLDETHVQTLDRSPESRARFHAILGPLREWLRPGGELVLFDAARHHALEGLVRAGLLRRHPLAPTIEWHKHQDPEVWVRLLLDLGFTSVDSHGAAFSRHDWVRRMFGGRKWASALVSPSFIVRARR